MRRASIEFDKIVAWALGAILLLVLIVFIAAQLRADGGGIMGQIIERMSDLF